jgi:sirohydrochlorin ferrochelatase
LLSTGYHLTTDIIGSGRRVAGPLGPDQLLVTALASRLADAGVPAGVPIVLAAAGSSDPIATGQVEAQAKLLAGELDAEVVPAYAASGHPTVPDAVAGLRERYRGPVAIASYLLAKGHFHDSLADSGADWVTEPLGAHPAVAALIIDRYRAIPA